MKIPKFLLYGQDDPQVEKTIQPHLAIRRWGDLTTTEKETALRELRNKGWLTDHSSNILETIEYLNHQFLRQCPGKTLHRTPPQRDYRGYDNSLQRKEVAFSDFQNIFLNDESDSMVFRMLTSFAYSYIEHSYLEHAEQAESEEKRDAYVAAAFKQFDALANCLNHIFEQFAVNVLLTRSALVPRQDERITEEVYIPTLKILADPKWKTVSSDLTDMFEDYREENYPETITKAHRAVQRFLQVLVGEEGKSGKGEMSKLFEKAKREGIIPTNRFTEPIIGVFQSFITSERATNSTAKPTLKDATFSDALLVMNVVMVFLQYCLQNPNNPNRNR